MKYIKLTKGHVTKVDDMDYPNLIKHQWYFHPNGYAVRKPKSGTIRMHREILMATSKDLCDHINGDKLDNRRNNLRLCNKSQNNVNRPNYKNNKLGLKGVYLDKIRNLFVAEIKFQHKRYHLGRFSTSKEAALAYNNAAIKLHRDFAKLNTI